MSRLTKTLTIAAVLALGVTGFTRAEVWVELDGSGHVIATHVPSSGNTARVWRATGEAPSLSQVLNTEGAARGDGRPDIAIDPVSGLPRAVWSMRTGGGFDIVTSTFDGRAWTEPIPITSSFRVDDLDPKIAFRTDGLALVTWWTNTATASTVQVAALPHGGLWRSMGAVSAPNERAKLPAIRQEGSLTIVAYRAPSVRISTRVFVNTDFGDGPTPFPRDNGGNNGPSTGDDPPPAPPDNP